MNYHALTLTELLTEARLKALKEALAAVEAAPLEDPPPATRDRCAAAVRRLIEEAEK